MAARILARATLKEDPLLPVAALREAMQQAGMTTRARRAFNRE
jgi:hypothetical protein